MESEEAINGRRRNGTWAPGVSGNPGGRPPGHPSLFRLVQQVLSERIDAADPDSATKYRVAAESFVDMLLQGELGAFREVMDREDPKMNRLAVDRSGYEQYAAETDAMILELESTAEGRARLERIESQVREDRRTRAARDG